MPKQHSTPAPIQNTGVSAEDIAVSAQVTLAQARDVLLLIANKEGGNVYFLLIDLLDKASDQLEPIVLGEVAV